MPYLCITLPNIVKVRFTLENAALLPGTGMPHSIGMCVAAERSFVETTTRAAGAPIGFAPSTWSSNSMHRGQGVCSIEAFTHMRQE